MSDSENEEPQPQPEPKPAANSPIKKGIAVNEEELQATFDFLDPDKTGKISLHSLKTKMAPFYKDMSLKEYKFLLDGQNEITREELRNLLIDNDLENFDPVAEAFKVYDPQGTGFVDMKNLKYIFEKLGMPELTEDDINIIIEVCDSDKDGRINLNDFRNLLSFQPNVPTNVEPPSAPQ